MNMRIFFYIGSWLLLINSLIGQSLPRYSQGAGVLMLTSPDSVAVFTSPSGTDATTWTWHNYTSVAEHGSSTFWSSFGVFCLKDSLDWYKVIAVPYYDIDSAGEPHKAASYKIGYIRAAKQVTFSSWAAYLPEKYIYSFEGKAYADTSSIQPIDCNLSGCLVCVRVQGDWMEVRPPFNHDCTAMLGEACTGSAWIRWRNDHQLLIALKPF